MATELNLSIDQGSPFSKKIRVLNADGSNYDLTNHTAKAQFRVNVRAPDAALELSTENSRLLIDVLNNTIEIKPDHTATGSMLYAGVANANASVNALPTVTSSATATGSMLYAGRATVRDTPYVTPADTVEIYIAEEAAATVYVQAAATITDANIRNQDDFIAFIK